MDVLDSELTMIPWKHFFYLGKQRRRRRLSNKKALYWNDDVALMRLRGSHFASSSNFVYVLNLFIFKIPSNFLPSHLAPFMKRNFSWCFYILEWDKVGIWVYLRT